MGFTHTGLTRDQVFCLEWLVCGERNHWHPCQMQHLNMNIKMGEHVASSLFIPFHFRERDVQQEQHVEGG